MKKVAKKTAKKVTANVVVDGYIAQIKVLGKSYWAEGTSIADAINNLQPGIAKGMAVLTIKHGEKHQERILPAFTVTRLFSRSPMMKEIALKQVAARFGI